MKRTCSPSLIIRLFLCEVLLSVIASCYFLLNTPNPHSTFFEHRGSDEPPIPLNIEENDWTNQTRALIQRAFNSYWKQCKGSDYLKPLSGKCLNSSSLSITAIEALETLYLAKLDKEYEVTKQYVINEFQCESSDYINTNELATRVIGGLLGAFGLTNDVAFLRKAFECGEVLLKAFDGPVPHPIINGKTKRGYDYAFMDGTLLSESAGFILEFASLSKLTGDKRFISHVEKYLKTVSEEIHASSHLPIIIPTRTGPGIGKGGTLEAATASFIANVLRVHMLDPSKITERIIREIALVLNRQSISFAAELTGHTVHSSVCQVYSVLEHFRGIEFSSVKNTLRDICDAMSSNFLPIELVKTKSGRFYKESTTFRFDAWPLITSLAKRKGLNDITFMDKLSDSECGDSQCLIISQDPVKIDDVQPSDAIGQWLKFLYLRNTEIQWNSTVVNEAGHFIPI